MKKGEHFLNRMYGHLKDAKSPPPILIKVSIHFKLDERGCQQAFSVKGQVVNIEGFAGHNTFPVAAAQLCIAE